MYGINEDNSSKYLLLKYYKTDMITKAPLV